MAAFEVLRFEAVPAAAGVALLELEGVFAAGPAPAKPRLLLEYGGRSRELPAVVSGGDPHAWSATFAVPIEALDGDQHGFALVPGRGPVIGLPAPDLAGGEDDRFVRLARSANDLRHRLAEASASAATSSERYAEIAEERDRLAAELESTRARAEAAEQAAEEIRAAGEEADRAAAEAREELGRERERLSAEEAALTERLDAEAARAEAAEAAARHEQTLRSEVQAEVDRLHQEISEAADEADALRARVVAAENEAQATRLELREARSRLQNLQRDRPAAARGATAAENAPLEWADGPSAQGADDLGGSAGAGEADFDGRSDADPTLPIDVDTEPTAEIEADDDDDTEATRAMPRAKGRRTIRLEPHDDDVKVLDPAAVGARFIEPSTTRPPLLAITPARIAVGIAVLLLVIALVIIFAGGGLV